jgi:hypothetical protein
MMLLPAAQGLTGMGEIIGKLLVSITKILVKLTETGGMTNFFGILTKAADVIAKMFDNAIVMKVFTFTAAIAGASLALSVLSKTAGFAGKVMLGKLLFPITMVTKAYYQHAYGAVFAKGATLGLSKGMVTLGETTLVALGPFLLVVAAIAAVIIILVLAYKKSEIFQQAVRKMAKAIGNTLGDAIRLISSAFKGLGGGINSIGDIFKALGDIIGKYVIPIFTFLIQYVIKVIAFQITFLIGIIRIFFAYFIGGWRLIGAVFTAIRTGKIEPLKKAFYDFVNGMIDGVNVLIRAINSVSKYLGFTSPEIGHLGETTKKLTKEQKEAAKAAAQHAAELKQTKHNAAELDAKFKDTGQIYAFLTDKATAAFTAATSHARALIASRDAAKSLRQTDATLLESLKDSTKMTIDKKDSLYEFAGAYLDAADAAVKAGKSSGFVQKIIDDGKKKFIDGAAAIGMGATEAKKLATNLGLSDSVITKTFKVNGLDDLRTLNGQLETLNKITSGGKEYTAAIKDWMKKHKMTAAEKADKTGAGSKAYGKRAEDAVMGAARKATTEVKSEIALKMEVNFGRGQAKGKPMFVQVTNPKDVKNGTDKGMYTGGQVKGGSTYLVGERGPELFQTPTSGNIIPNHQVGMGNTINLTVNPSPGMDEREIANLMSRRLAFMQRGA